MTQQDHNNRSNSNSRSRNDSRDGNRRRSSSSNSPSSRSTAPTAAPGQLSAATYVAPAVPLTFTELEVPAPLVAVLASQGITSAFPIQAATLPDSLQGRDVLGRGRTGSGKTVAFALPTVARLAASGRRRTPSAPRALVLVPTRELANQVAEVIAPLAAALDLRVTTVFGGVGQGRQVAALKGGIDILIACPGRLEDLIGQRHVRLDQIEITVLDEADHMADLGFLPGVTRLLSQTPSDGQRMLFSATLDRGVDVLVRRFLSAPVTHSVDSGQSPVATMEHHVFAVTATEKPAVIRRLVGGEGRTVAFTRTKHQAKKLAKTLTAQGIPSVDLHGNLSQNARERNLASFSDGTVRVLVATDIAARGIHVDDITLVVHVDPPAEHKAYLHRSGRTARAGAEGVVVTVATPDQASDVRLLMRQAGITAQVQSVSGDHPAVADLAGPMAAFVEPAPEPAPTRQSTRPSRSRNSPGGSRSQAGSRGQGTSGGQRSQGGSSSQRSQGGSSGQGGQGGSGGQRRRSAAR